MGARGLGLSPSPQPITLAGVALGGQDWCPGAGMAVSNDEGQELQEPYK